MRAEVAILRRWLCLGGALLAGCIGLAVLSELQRLMAKDHVPTLVDLGDIVVSGCLAGAVGTPLALAFAATQVMSRLHRDSVLTGLMVSGFGLARLRRCFFAMAFVAILLTLGLQMLAAALDSPPQAPLHATAEGWQWSPRPPAVPVVFERASLQVVLRQDAFRMPAAGAWLPSTPGVVFALAGGATVAVGGFLGTTAAATRPLLVHGVMLYVAAATALLYVFEPGLALAASLALLWHRERTFARSGLRRQA